MELIHHYTDIQSLACILKNRTLRFTRLDKLDDAQEVELVSRKHWSQYLFVSSWSTLTDESQAMWQSYAGYNGVRIGLPKHPFAEFTLESRRELNHFVKGEIISPLPIEQIYNEKWIIINTPYHKDLFGQAVKYYKKPDEHIRPVMQDEKGGILFNYYDLAVNKSSTWKHQEEFRYIYFIVPSNPNVLDAWKRTGNPFPIYQHTYEHLQKKKNSPITYFYSPLGDALNHVEVTIGPTCTGEDVAKIEELVSRYTTHGKIQRSDLTGYVKE